MNDESMLLTADEVGKRLQVPTWSVYQLIKDGGLPAVRIGRRVRVKASSLERWLSEHEQGGK